VDPQGMAASEQSSTLDDVKDRAQETAGQAGGKARERIREQIDQRSTEAGRQVGGMAGDVRAVGEELRNQGRDRPAQLADRAAEKLERAGGYLERSDADRFLGDVEDFGRARPFAVVAGGLMLGIVASRFLKASSATRHGDGRMPVTESGG
jgi:hypothetical protein